MEEKTLVRPDGTIIDSDMTLEEALSQNPDNPAPQEVIDKLTLLTVTYRSFDGKDHEGQIVVNKAVAADVAEAFRLMRVIKFPVQSVIPIVRFNFDDEASVDANNTSGFNYRTIAKTDKLSNHALGLAIDINPAVNPYIRSDYRYPLGIEYDPSRPGAITETGDLASFFRERGWVWGGDWKDRKDYQHFEKPEN